MKNLFKNSIVVVSAISFLGCASQPITDCKYPSPAKAAENHVPAFNLTGSQADTYKKIIAEIQSPSNTSHEAVIDPNTFKTNYSFYLLGFEKPPANSFKRPYCKPDEEDCTTPVFNPSEFKGTSSDNQNEIGKTRDDINSRLFGDPKSFVLTHVLNPGKHSSNLDSYSSNGCYIFNIYGNKETSWCQQSHQVNKLESTWKREGWSGLNQLAIAVNERAIHEKATHIILLATGWNTPQYESFLDFQAWMEQITEDFRSKNVEFRPIFIGTSWDSYWATSKALSVATVGNDADEIGFTWQNYLLNDLMKPIAKSTGAELVIIGHSFGSRIAFGSHYVRNILDRKTKMDDVPVTIIGLQAAFPIARFISVKGKEHQYVAANKGNSTVVITSSLHDSATGKMCTGTKYVGAGCGVKALNDDADYKDAATVLKTEQNGQPEKIVKNNQVSVYDASSFVNCQLVGTQSGAHSDVYDTEMGHFLGEIIRGVSSKLVQIIYRHNIFEIGRG